MKRALGLLGILLLAGAQPLFAACPQILVAPVLLPAGTTGTAYDQQLMQSGAATPAFDITSGALPGGLLMDALGHITGTPTATGTFTFTATVTENGAAAGCTGGRTYRIAVTCGVGTITLNPATLPNGQTGTTYGQSVSGSGGTGPYTYAVTSGALPMGLTLDTNTGAILNAPTLAGSYSFTITATDANGCTGSRSYSNVLVCDPPVITPTPAQVCANSTGNTASGPAGATTYAWSITNGSITSATNIQTITYTAGASGTTNLTLTVTNAAGCSSSSTLNVTINAAPATPTITPTPAQVCANSTGNTATTGAATTYAWTITNGTITSAANIQTITYTAGASGTVALHLIITNAQGCASAQANQNVTIAPNPTLAPAAGTLNALYHNGFNQVFTAAAGTPPFTFTINPVTPPAGLTFTPGATTATLSGAAGTLPNTTTNGTNFTVTVTDANNCSASQMYSLVIRPNTVGDAYMGGVGNTQYVITGYTPAPTTPVVSSAVTLIANDVYPGAATLAVTTASTHGAVSLLNAGTFLYTPNIGDTAASDSFGYTLTDGNGVTNTATVSISLTGMVWYVNNTIPSTGDGRSQNPFKLLSDAQGPAVGKSQIGQIIYVHTGAGNTTGNLTLLANQMLIGNGVALSIGGLSLAAAANPTLAGTGPGTSIVTVANGNTVSGVTITNSGSSLITGAPAVFTLSSSTLTPSGTANGINLTGGSGAVAITNVTFTGTSTGDVIKSNTGTHSWVFTSSPITQTAGRALNVTNKTGGGMTFDAASTITVSAGTTDGAVTLSANSGGEIFTFGKLALTTAGTARALVISSSGAVSNTDGTSTIATADSATVCGGGNCSAAVDASGSALGLTFRSINVTATNAHIPVGISLSATTGSFTVSGNASAGTGGTIQSCSLRGARFSNATNVNLSFMNFTGNGTANLDPAGTCGDMVNGTNTNCAAGIDLQNVNTALLTSVHVSGGAQIGINGNSVTALTLTGVEVNNAGNEANESGIQIHGLFGTTTWSNVNIHDNASRQVNIQNSTSTAVNLTISNSTLANTAWPGSATSAQGILFSGSNAANMTISVQNCTIARNFSAALQSDSSTGANINTTVNGGSLIDNGQHFVIASTGSGNMTYALTNVTTAWVDGAAGTGHSQVTPISIFNAGSGAFTGSITGNTFGLVGTANSAACNGGCNVMVINNSASSGSDNATITGNTIQRSGGGGISVTSGGGGGTSAMRVKIETNTLSKPDGNGSGLPIAVVNTTVVGDATSTCANILSNSIDNTGGVGTWNIANAIRLRNPIATAGPYTLPGYSGPSNNYGMIVTYLNGRNTITGGSSSVQNVGNYTNTPGGADCF